MRWVVRRRLHVDELTHRVMDLHGVEPNMGMRHAKAVIGDLGLQNDELAAMLDLVRETQCALDQFEQLCRIDQA